MNDEQHDFEQVDPGDSVSVENVQDRDLSISVATADGSRMTLELAPGQVIELVAGDGGARVLLHHGDPTGLLVVKPDTA
ncbi:MAG: hypothetical protein ACNA7W_08620 [Pseudomonadales bacterium]